MSDPPDGYSAGPSLTDATEHELERCWVDDIPRISFRGRQKRAVSRYIQLMAPADGIESVHLYDQLNLGEWFEDWYIPQYGTIISPRTPGIDKPDDDLIATRGWRWWNDTIKSISPEHYWLGTGVESDRHLNPLPGMWKTDTPWINDAAYGLIMQRHQGFWDRLVDTCTREQCDIIDRVFGVRRAGSHPGYRFTFDPIAEATDFQPRRLIDLEELVEWLADQERLEVRIRPLSRKHRPIRSY